MMLRLRRRTCVVVVLLAAVGLAGAWSAVGARAAARPRVSSGPVGIVRGQTARFALVNVGDERGIAVDGGRFYDSAGNVVAQCEGTRLVLGQMFTCDFDGGRLDVTGRVEMTAVIDFQGHESDVVASLQVFGNDDGASRVGWGFTNHNETLVREPE